jgi:hypothetical protein
MSLSVLLRRYFPAMDLLRARRLDPAGVCLIALAVALASTLGLVGADARWLAALGAHLSGLIGPGAAALPQAAAPSSWVDVPALAELVFHGLEAALGDRGLVAAQAVAVGSGFTLLWLTARRSAGSGAVFLSLLIVLVGALPSFLIARSQLFSLALFPALLYLLARDEERAGRGIWLLLPLVALWSNLHGVVLTGCAVAGAYLLTRARAHWRESLAVLACLPLAVCATPALWRTPDYYRGVLANESARRGVGLWAPLSLHGLGLLFAAGAALLLLAALRGRPRLWELLALAGLALLTVQAARGGVWLLMVASAPAARGLKLQWQPRSRPCALASAMLCALAVAGLARGPLEAGAAPGLITTAVARAHGRPILAEGQIAEQVMLAGGQVVIANPLDAFPRRYQQLYLDWLAGRPQGDEALDGAGAILVVPHSPAAQRLAQLAPGHRLRLAASSRRALLYLPR